MKIRRIASNIYFISFMLLVGIAIFYSMWILFNDVKYSLSENIYGTIINIRVRETQNPDAGDYFYYN